MRQVPLERDINIAVNGCSGLATSTQKGPFMAMLISRSRGTYLIAVAAGCKQWKELLKIFKALWGGGINILVPATLQHEVNSGLHCSCYLAIFMYVVFHGVCVPWIFLSSAEITRRRRAAAAASSTSSRAGPASEPRPPPQAGKFVQAKCRQPCLFHTICCVAIHNAL